MKSLRLIAALAALALAPLAHADAWNEDTVNWGAPASCSNGEPLTSCPVTGYKVETAASKTATTWTTAATVGNVLTAKITGLTAGTHCYRVSALSANGAGPVQVQGNDCPVAIPPVPGQPTNVVTVETTAYNVRADFQRFAFVRSTRFGKVNLGASCDESRSVGNGYYVIDRLSQVTPRPPAGTVLVAKCG